MDKSQELMNSINELRAKYFLQQAHLFNLLFDEHKIEAIHVEYKKIDGGVFYEIASIHNEHGSLDIYNYTQESDEAQKELAFDAKFKMQAIDEVLNTFEMLCSEFLDNFRHDNCFGILELTQEDIKSFIKEWENV